MNNIPPRAWLHEEKTMVEVSRYDYEYGHIQWATSKQSPDYTVYLSDCTILWATGREDNDGKMWYDGDLVKSNKGKIFEVVWDRTQYKFTVRQKNIYGGRNSQYLYISIGWAYNHCIKVGNRYENPEMLEADDED